jgi:hypothetical protein
MFWLGLLIVPVVTLMVDVCCKALYNTWYPKVIDQVRQIERRGDDREFVWEPLQGRLLPRQRDSGIMLDSTQATLVPQRGYAFSQDEGGQVTLAEIALHENTDMRFAERMARRSRESLAASSMSSMQGSPRSIGKDRRVKGGAKIKHL